MTSTISVWILISMSGANVVSYSPPTPSLEVCQALQKEVSSLWGYKPPMKCVQIKVIK